MIAPEEVVRLCEALLPGARGSVTFGAATLDVAAGDWEETVRAVRDDPVLGMRMFDFLTAVDLMADGFAVVLRLVSVEGRSALLMRAAVPRHEPEIASLAYVFAGAAWSEREAAEMFGIRFAGHPDPRPLLLADTFDGHPLRKDFVLASRAVAPWPGAHDPRATGDVPGRAAAGGAARQRAHRPPGGVDPAEWMAGGGPDD